MLCPNLFVSAHFDSVNGHSELVIERVSKEDSGTYVCTAENSIGFVKAIGFVYVKGRKKCSISDEQLIYNKWFVVHLLTM